MTQRFLPNTDLEPMTPTINVGQLLKALEDIDPSLPVIFRFSLDISPRPGASYSIETVESISLPEVVLDIPEVETIHPVTNKAYTLSAHKTKIDAFSGIVLS